MWWLVVAIVLIATTSSAGEVRRLRLCADPSNLPFSSRDAGEPGFEVEIARAIAAALEAELTVHWVPTAREIIVLRQLYERRCDLVMGFPITAGVMEAALAGWFVTRNAGFVATEIGDPGRDLQIGAAVRKADLDLKASVDRAIQQLAATTLPAILARYGITLAQARPPGTTLSPELRAARSTFLTQCSQCHGTDAKGTPAASNLQAFKGSEADFVRVVQTGRPGTGMTPWKGLISEQDIRAIARYIKQLATD